MTVVAPLRVVRPPGVDLADLAHAARRALGADAVALVDLSDARDPVALGIAGLADDEGDRVVAAVAGAAFESGPPPGFTAQLRSDAARPGEPLVALYALRRSEGQFESPGLAPAFARHAQVALLRARTSSAATAPDARLLGGLGLDRLVAVVTDEVRAAIGPVRAGIRLWDEGSDELELLPGSFGAPADIVASARSAAHDWDCCAARVFATGQPYATDDAVGDPGVRQDVVAALDLRSLAVVPLELAGDRIGALEVADHAAGFSAATVAAIEDLAPVIAAAASYARARDTYERRLGIDAILRAVAVDIASGKSLQTFLDGALEQLCVHMDAAAVLLVARTGDPLIVRRDDDRPELEEIVVAEARHLGAMRSFVSPPRRMGDPGWAATHVPVVIDGDRVATLSVLRHRGVVLEPESRCGLSQMAALIALAWATEAYQHQRAQLALDAERRRIGDELHDQFAQLLFAVRLRLDAALEAPKLPAQAGMYLERARVLVVRADARVRDVIHDLAADRPETVADLLAGVVAAIEEEFDRVVALDIAPAAVAETSRLGSAPEALLAKVAREALVNAAKHAGPCQLALRLRVARRERVLLTVVDDGIGGAGRRPEGHGLASLRRAVRRQGGVLRVRVGRTGGTKVTLSLPLQGV